MGLIATKNGNITPLGAVLVMVAHITLWFILSVVAVGGFVIVALTPFQLISWITMNDIEIGLGGLLFLIFVAMLIFAFILTIIQNISENNK